MKKSLIRHISFLPLLIFLSFLFFIFISCSEDTADATGSQGLVIFSYETVDSTPTARLSVFVDVASDLHRAQSVRLICRENHYEWEAMPPTLITNKESAWAGWTNFVYPMGEPPAQGAYTAIYIDAQEKRSDTVFSLDYPKDLMTTKESDLKDFLNKEFPGRWTKKFALYDGEGVLIYWGDQVGDPNNPRDIFSYYGEAETYRECVFITGTCAMCLLSAVRREAEGAGATGE